MSSRVGRMGMLLGVLAVSLSALAGPVDEKAYRAGIGLANKGANEAAAQELNRYLSSGAEGVNVVSARYTLGVCYARMGKHAEAASELDAVLGAGTGVQGFAFLNDARLLRAQCAAATGDYASASAVLKKLLKDAARTEKGFDRLDQVAALYGESEYRLGRVEQARAVLGEFATRWPGSESVDRAELICALAEMSLGETRSAEGRLEAILKRSPNGPMAGSAALALGQSRQNSGDGVGARAMFEIAAKSGDPAIAFDAGLGAAKLARAAGDLDGAEDALRVLEAMKATQEQAVQVKMERGKVLVLRGKAEEGAALFADLVKNGPEGARTSAELWLAKSELKTGQAASAAERLKRLSEKSETANLMPEILFDRAVALAQTGDDAGAEAIWSDWQKRYENHALAAQAGASRAACLYRLGKYEQSLGVCLGVRGLAYSKQSEVLLLMGEDLFFLERYAEANEAYERFLKDYPDDPAGGRIAIRRGVSLEKLGRHEEAERALTAAIERAGGETDKQIVVSAYSTLGDMCIAKEDWAGAEKWLTRAVEAGGKGGDGGEGASAELLLRAGVAALRQGHAGEAVSGLERAWRASKGTAIERHAEFEYANALVLAGRADEATERLHAILRSEKESGKAVLTSAALRQLASIASAKGDAKGAAETLARIDLDGNGAGGGAGAEGSGALLEQAGAWLAAGEYAKAEEVCNRYLESRTKGKGATVARARRAIAMNRQGRHEEALRELSGIAGKAASLDAETRESAGYETALALRALGRIEEAASAYRKLLESGGSVEAYAALELSQIALDAGRIEEAGQLLERCRGVSGKLAPAEIARIAERETYVRALCLSASGKAAETADLLAGFEKAYPTSELLPAARLTLGDALGKAGRAREAAAVFERVANDPGAGTNRGYALLKLGEVSASGQMWEESEKAYSAYLGAEASSALWFQARFGQGLARENMGNLDGASEAYRDVVDRHEGPTAARAQFQIGECLYAQKKLEEAVRELLKVDVLYGYPEWSAAALYEAGRCLREMGKEKEAAAQFAEVVERFGGTRWAELAKRASTATVSSAGKAGG